MIGMAITTTAIWILADSTFFCKQESEAYRRFAQRFSRLLYTIGLVWMAAAGSWYILGTLPPEILEKALDEPWVKFSFAIAGGSALLPWILLVLKARGMSVAAVWFAVALQLLVITSNAISRQWVQIAEIERFMPLSRDPVNWQWSPLVVFLLLFLLGLSTIGWMVRTILKVPPLGANEPRVE